MHNEVFGGIISFLKNSEKTLFIGHFEPDGDLLGSMLATQLALKKLGRNVDIFCASNVSENYKVLPGFDGIKKQIEPDYDLVVGFDYGDWQRLETTVQNIPVPLPAVTFDHHPYFNQTGELMVIDPKASSTCEIIYGFLADSGIEIDKDIATCLLTGIFSDTWNLRHPNATADTFRVVGELILKGVSVQRITKLNDHNDISIKSKIWGAALANITFDKESGGVFCYFNHEDLAKVRATHRDLSGLSSFISTVPEARFSLVMSEFRPGNLDGSLRALPDKGVDVSKIAKALGGGGHKLSAGFKTQASPEQVFATIRGLMRAGS